MLVFCYGVLWFYIGVSILTWSEQKKKKKKKKKKRRIHDFFYFTVA